MDLQTPEHLWVLSCWQITPAGVWRSEEERKSASMLPCLSPWFESQCSFLKYAMGLSPEAAPEVVDKMLTKPWLLHTMGNVGVPTVLIEW